MWGPITGIIKHASEASNRARRAGATARSAVVEQLGGLGGRCKPPPGGSRGAAPGNFCKLTLSDALKRLFRERKMSDM